MRLHRILIVGHDKATRGLLRAYLSGTYSVMDTGDPEQALGLALAQKPDAIILDLTMQFRAKTPAWPLQES